MKIDYLKVLFITDWIMGYAKQFSRKLWVEHHKTGIFLMRRLLLIFSSRYENCALT